MKSELVEQASKVIPDHGQLINMVSKRLRELNEGQPSLVQPPSLDYGEADIALLEIIQGKVRVAPAAEPADA